MRKVLDGRKDFTNLYSPPILTPVSQLNCNKHISYSMQPACMPPRTDKYVADTLQKLPHPPVSLLSHCPQPQKYREAKKGCRVGSGILGTHWPQQHVSFHASFIHFITSLDECEGVEEKPCHPETEGEELYSIFSSPGPVLPSAWTLYAWITLLQGRGG